MLTISRAQQTALREHIVREFVDRMRSKLRKSFPHATKAFPDQELTEQIRSGITRAEALGLGIEQHTQVYLEAMFCFGMKFDSPQENSEWYGLLNGKRLSADEKASRLHEAVVFASC